MPKYRVSASIMISVYHLDIDLDCPPELGHTLEHAVIKLLNERITILDLKGGRSGQDGIICPILTMNVEITNVTQE